MSKELILVSALTDADVSEALKKCILEMPKESFKHSLTRKLFSHFKEFKDIVDLDSADMLKLSECLTSTEYKVFSGLAVSSQMPTLESILDIHRKELLTKMLDDFNLKMLNNEGTAKDLLREFVVEAAGIPSVEKAVSAAEAMEELMEYVRNTMEGKQVPVIPTGYRCLDNILDGGFGDGDVILITGNSGDGKTTFIQNVLNNILYNDKTKRILYLTTEMKTGQLMQKFSCLEAYERDIPGMTLALFKDEHAPPEFYERLTLLGAILSGYNIDFQWCTNPEDLSFFMNRKEYDLVCMDHVHDLKGMDGKEANSVAADIMYEFKEWAIAGDFRSCVVLAQPRKKGVDRVSGSTALVKDDIKGSQALQAKASVVMAVRRGDDGSTTFIDILKNRFGECNKAAVFKFDTFSGRYVDPSDTKNKRRK